MPRRRHRSTTEADISTAVGLLLLVGISAYPSLSILSKVLIIILVILLLVAGTILYLLITADRRAKLRALTLANIDHMTGGQFEHYVAELLKHQGYSDVCVTQLSGDYGADLIATKDNVRWAIQAKRYTGHVGVPAVQQAVAACAYYGCQSAMVVTTSRFTYAAQKLARTNRTTLVDRDTPAEWILAFQKSR